MTEPDSYDSVGKPKTRVDGYEKVTGQAAFAGDIAPGRMLHARVVRSARAHARLLAVDTSEAMQVAGVRAVLTGQDVPRRIGDALEDHWVIARGKVRYWGEPVAVVIAATVEAAEQAAGLVRVEYEPLPVVVNPHDAVLPGAPLIHEELGDYTHVPGVHPLPGTNIAHAYRLRRGDVEQAFAQAHLVVEEEYWVPWIAHVQLEPHAAVCRWDGERFTLWCSSQSPFFVRETVAHLFGLSPAMVRVIVPYVGGGFGGKSDVTIEPLLAAAAHAVPGFAVQLVLTREEVFFGTVVGRGAWGRMKMAVDAEGKLLAEQAELYFGSGGSANYSVWVAQGGGHNATGPYYIPNLDLRSHAVYTNTPPTGAYRGYGHPEVQFMAERTMDLIAERLGADPVELRRKNLLVPGQQNALGQTLKPSYGRPERCLQAVVEALGAKRPPSRANKARGQALACFMKSPVMRTNAQSGAVIRFNADGTATLFTGAVEMGQGVNTILSQIAAEALHMPAERIHYAGQIDTDYSPQEWQTVASHTTWAVGSAVRQAAEDALEQLRAAAAEVFCLPVSDIDAQNGRLFPSGQPDKGLAYEELATGITRPDGQAVNPAVTGQANFVPKGLTNPDPVTGQGNVAASWTFGCQGAEIEVDLDTGQVEVLRLVSAQDPGRVINPETARGQVEGAMLMGLGAALMEKIKFGPDGRVQNPSFVDYRILTSTDAPEMEVIFLETDDATGPYGARGLGEHGIVAIPPAIAGALADAIGEQFREIPITPDTIYDAIEEKRKGGGSQST